MNGREIPILYNRPSIHSPVMYEFGAIEDLSKAHSLGSFFQFSGRFMLGCGQLLQNVARDPGPLEGVGIDKPAGAESDFGGV